VEVTPAPVERSRIISQRWRGRVAVLGGSASNGFGFELKQALRTRGMEPRCW